MKRWVSLLASAFLGTAVTASAVAADGVNVEVYHSAKNFKARLAGTHPVKVVNFDRIDTSSKLIVPFKPERFRMKLGMVITGEGGQYVSRDFDAPRQFIPVSRPNMYAPGPVDWTSTTGTAGGNETDVTFFAWDAALPAAGFGCYFLDADFPLFGPSSLQIYEAGDFLVGDSGPVETPNAGKAFFGFVTVDPITNEPVAAITRAHIVNGSGWAGNAENEGTALDNFMAGTATFKVKGRVVDRAGRPMAGVTVQLENVVAVTARTNGKGIYAFRNVPPGSYTATPKKRDILFRPPSQPVDVVDADVTVPRFVGR